MNQSELGNTSQMPGPGDKLGAYEIVGQIGVGAMARVLKGHDRLLSRDVAIKQIAAEYNADPVWRDRFKAEAELHMRVSGGHDHLVDVIDFIDDPRGLFLVMEYVAGSNLERALEQLNRPMEVDAALRLLKQTASALAALHQAEVVHRDLKPSNILLTETGKMKVADLGLATLISEQETLELGSARYMAPELFGDGPVDGRADIYALGMIAYEMLAGRAAFGEAFKTVLRDQRHQPMRWMKWHTNPRLTVPALHEVNPEVPEILSDLVARMMAKDPGQRIDSAESLIVTIERHFVGSQVVESAPAAGPAAAGSSAVAGADVASTAPLPKRNRLLIAVVAMSVFWVAAIGGVLYYVYVEQPRAAQRKGLDEARAAMERAKGLMETGDAAAALPISSVLADQWSGKRLGREARAHVLVCEAAIEIVAIDSIFAVGHFEQVTSRYAAVRTMLNEADALGFERYDTVGLMGQLRQSIDWNHAQAQRFAEIERSIQAGDFATARSRWSKINDDYRRLRELDRRALDALRNQLNQKIASAAISKANREADVLIAAGDLAGALARLEETERRYSRETQADRIAGLKRLMAFTAAREAGRAAEARGNRSEAIAHYDRADRLVSGGVVTNQPVADRLARLRSEEAYEEGQRYENQTPPDRTRAVLAYRRSRDFHENKLAQDAIERLDTQSARESLIIDGDEAFAAGNYSTAVRHYTAAMARGADATTSGKLAAAQVRQLVEHGTVELRRGELDAAAATLSEATAIDAEDFEVTGLRDEINVRIQYRELIKAGDAARDQADYAKAKGYYGRARDLLQGSGLDDRAVRVRLRDVNYASWVARARTAIAGERWKEAKAMLNTAAGIRDTDEIRTLRAQVANNEPDEE